MKVTDADLLISAVGPKQYPQDARPEVALVGRSNVGKSSLINQLLNRRSLARTSSRPGKTQTLNFYFINRSFYFVDLPGYGFANVSKKTKSTWGRMIEHYLHERQNLACVIQLVDLRHPPSSDDQMMFNWLKHYTIPTVLVATKADKISRGRWPHHVKTIRRRLGTSANEPVVVFSAQTGEGKEALWGRLIPFIS